MAPPAMSAMSRRGRSGAGLVEGQQARERDEVDVVPGPVGVGSGLAEAGERAMDEAGVARAQGRRVHAEPARGARPEALHDDVGARGERVDDRGGARRPQVERQALLAEVERPVVDALARDERRERAQRIAAARVLDLDHLGAELGQREGAHRARQQAREVEDGEAVERQRGHGVGGARRTGQAGPPRPRNQAFASFSRLWRAPYR